MNERSFISELTMSSTKPAADKRDVIFCATLTLLAKNGFHGFSIKQLAEEAGIAAGTIYLYFKDRDDLISKLHTQIIDDFVEATLKDHDASLPLKQQYQRICHNLWQFCIENPRIMLCKAQFDHLPPDVLRNQRDHAWVALKPLKLLFEQGRNSKQIKKLSDDILISLSIEPFIFLVRQHLLNIIAVDNKKLTHIIDAGWDAIAYQHAATPLTHGTPNQE